MTIALTCCCPRCWGKQIETNGDACLLCCGKGYVEDVLISEHFHYSELVHPHSGCANDPSADAIERIGALCREVLEPEPHHTARHPHGPAGRHQPAHVVGPGPRPALK